MPITIENQKKYPGGSIRSQCWQDIRAWVRLRSGDKCEGSPAFPDCRAVNGQPHPETHSVVVLTVAHVNHDPAKNGPNDVRHWCQRCHNTHDAPFRAKNRAIKERRSVRQKAIALKKELVNSASSIPIKYDFEMIDRVSCETKQAQQ